MKHLTKIYLLTFLVFADLTAFAGPGDNDGGGGLGGEDPPATPVNSYLIFMIGFALLLGFYFLTKYRKQNN
ncbi:hypothetical protein [Flavobacterium sp.]|uniref:hypothetical protein n=1 Tax=Flavobacterium sp. TaxID=239 RepID=UPI00378526FA